LCSRPYRRVWEPRHLMKCHIVRTTSQRHCFACSQ
jgi:hypothetical protein